MYKVEKSGTEEIKYLNQFLKKKKLCKAIFTNKRE